MDFARRLVDGDEYADIEGSLTRGNVPSSVPRSGPKLEIFRGSTWEIIDAAMVERIRSVTREIGTGTGDVAVLCATKRRATNAAAALTAAGLPTISLDDYTGAAVDAIKVGTIKRAKGLEC